MNVYGPRIQRLMAVNGVVTALVRLDASLWDTWRAERSPWYRASFLMLIICLSASACNCSDTQTSPDKTPLPLSNPSTSAENLLFLPTHYLLRGWCSPSRKHRCFLRFDFSTVLNSVFIDRRDCRNIIYITLGINTMEMKRRSFSKNSSLQNEKRCIYLVLFTGTHRPNERLFRYFWRFCSLLFLFYFFNVN